MIKKILKGIAYTLGIIILLGVIVVLALFNVIQGFFQ